MNELHRDKLSIIAGDEYLLEAINEVFEKHIAEHKPLVEKGENDSMLGQKYRAQEKARDIVRAGLREIRTYQQSKVDNQRKNKGK